MTLQKALLFLVMGSTVCLMSMSYLLTSAVAVSYLKPSRTRSLMICLALLGCVGWVVGSLALVFSYFMVLRKPTMVEALRTTWSFQASLSLLVLANLGFWIVGVVGARAKRRQGKAFEQERI